MKGIHSIRKIFYKMTLCLDTSQQQMALHTNIWCSQDAMLLWQSVQWSDWLSQFHQNIKRHHFTSHYMFQSAGPISRWSTNTFLSSHNLLKWIPGVQLHLFSSNSFFLTTWAPFHLLASYCICPPLLSLQDLLISPLSPAFIHDTDSNCSQYMTQINSEGQSCTKSVCLCL
jgi:hypothetical protein